MKEKTTNITKKEFALHKKYTEALDFIVTEIESGQYSQADIVEVLTEFSSYIKEKFSVRKEKV